jgi:superfamily I DNA/RNA helicase
VEAVGNLRAEEILEALDNEQRAVALATRGPVCVIAGAGTGKTRAITHRIAYAAAIGTMDPHKVLALTFTARAAGEMRTRLRSLGVPAVAAQDLLLPPKISVARRMIESWYTRVDGYTREQLRGGESWRP